MNWLNTIIVSIGAAFSSLFGSSHIATTSIPVSSVPVQQVTVSTQVGSDTAGGTTTVPVAVEQTGQSTQSAQTSDQQNIINTVMGMLNADRSVVTLQDVEKIMTTYASQSANAQFQTAVGNIPASGLPSVVQEFITIDHAYPDPASLKFTVAINNDMATATAMLPNTTITQPNAPGKVIVSTFQNSITVPLQKENGQWKVVKVIMTAKGVGNVIKTS